MRDLTERVPAPELAVLEFERVARRVDDERHPARVDDRTAAVRQHRAAALESARLFGPDPVLDDLDLPQPRDDERRGHEHREDQRTGATRSHASLPLQTK
ncbi:MAG: hypothetical protein R3F34_08195 [Planctomycetota bacterium]